MAASCSRATSSDAKSSRPCRRGLRDVPGCIADRRWSRARSAPHSARSCLAGGRSSIGFGSDGFAGISTSIRSVLLKPRGKARHQVIIPRFVPPAVGGAALTDLRSELSASLQAAVARIAPHEKLASLPLERPKQAQHGDYSSNAALQLAKTLKRNPREIAAAIAKAVEASPWLDRVEVAGAGFINLFLSAAARQEVVARILEEGDRYGRATAMPGATMVEFVSA